MTHPDPPTVQGFTIDATTSTDLDDAVWVEGDATTGWIAWVTIAAAAPAVHLGGVEDQRARAQAETRYHAEGHRSMLSHRTERALSLLPHRARRGLTVELSVSVGGEVGGAEVYPSVICSAAQLSHADVPTVLAGASHGHLLAPMSAAKSLAHALLAARRSRGAMALYDLHHGWLLDEEGRVRRVSADRSTVGYVIVQELMVAANAAVARFARERGVPILYRVHRALGEGPDRKDLLQALLSAEGSLLDAVERLQAQTDQRLERARYSATPGQHWGLSLPAYAHATSPIRRYADLVTQRQLWAHCHGLPLPYTQDDLAAVADHLNRVLAERRDRAEATAANRANAAGSALLERGTADSLMRLDDTRFVRVLKVAARSGEDCPPALAEAVCRRMEASTLPVVGMVVALLESPRAGEGWGDVRRSLVGHLAEHAPHHAPSVLAVAVEVGLLPPVQRSAVPVGEQGPFDATSWVSLGGTDAVAGPIVRRTRKKEAAALADVGLLAALVGEALPDVAGSSGSGERRGPTTKLVVDPTKPPVSMLNEVVQALRWPAPTYVLEARAEGTLSFTCLVSVLVGGDQGPKALGAGIGASKAVAKREAARRMLKTLAEHGFVTEWEGASCSG